MLEIKNYSMEYFKGKKVIDGLDLTVKDGDIYAFVGRNGAGKTTTIKSVVGINHITEGDIILDKVSILKNPLEYKNMVAYIPDSPALYESLTGIQYLNFVIDALSYGRMKKNLVPYVVGTLNGLSGAKT